jgi:methionyl-tRNA formyltransferase
MAQELSGNQPYMKPIRADDNRIDLAAPAEQTYRLIRSCVYPYPNAFIDFGGLRIYVERARLEKGAFTELKVRVGGPAYAAE